MTHQPEAWTNPAPTASAPYRVLIIAASLVVALGSVGGYLAATSAPPAAASARRSVRLVPSPVARTASAGAAPAAPPRPTPLEPSPPPRPFAAPGTGPASPTQPVSFVPSPGAAGESAGAPAATPAEAPATPGLEPGTAPTAEPPPASADASGRKAHPLLAHEPLPDGSVTGAREGETAVRKAIEARLAGGRATADELKMLRAICQHQGDVACQGRADEALRKASE